MSNLEVIGHLEDMLRMALDIINEQASLLEQHGIHTESCKLEAEEQRFREMLEGWC